MDKHKYSVRSKVWLYPGMAGWHFLSVPKATSRQIKILFGGMSGGWGSIPVTVSLGKTIWQTSIFPDAKTGTYLLPLKSEVRKKEVVTAGDTVRFTIEIRL